MIRLSTAHILSIPLGVLVQREEKQDWHEDRWRAVAVVLDPPEISQWRTVPAIPRTGPVHAATVPLTLDFHKAMEYRVNLANGEPSVYVVLRDGLRRTGEPRVDVRLVSASPFEVQPYRDSGYETVDRVPMPVRLVDLIREQIGIGELRPAAGV